MGDIWVQGTRPEMGTPSLLLLRMEEGGAKNQHQASLWEGWGVKITPLALEGSFSNAPRDTKTLNGVELKVGLKGNAALRRGSGML